MPEFSKEENRLKTILESNELKVVKEASQFSTFYIDGRWYGIDVMKVQEVTKPMSLTKMRTAPPFINGLINLRGQIATAIGLREFFGLKTKESIEKMVVVCRIDDVLISLLVDQIGDVVEADQERFESCPISVPSNVRMFVHGVYKMDGAILSVLKMETIMQELEKRCAA
jgi:purine-binding chemotaxis protein CheW